jgi:DNA polymerase-3 subunit delta'
MTLQPWLDAPWRRLADALRERRLHHGLLFSAPAGLGKRALADAFAAAALCSQPGEDGMACTVCRSCTLIAAGSHPDLVRVSFGLRDDGKPRTEITIDQMRSLSQRLSMSSQFGGLQIAIVDPADCMNASAANALLKTLEEPATATVIALVADDRARLPATIRSRCQRVDVPAPTREQALAWLHSQRIDSVRAQTALTASLGNPGRALDWCGDGALAVRDGCAEDLVALIQGRRSALEVAERWAGDRPDLRLWFAAALAGDEARSLASGKSGPLGLTARAEIPKLAAWFARVNRARGLLATSLRMDLVLLDLLRAWSTAGTGSGRA